MIHLILGENAYAAEQEIGRLVHGFDGEVVRVEASKLEPNTAADLIAGATLFSNKTLIVVRRLSENKPIWDWLAEHTDRLAEGKILVLVEPKPDRRTKSYKAIAKVANIIQVAHWTDRDRRAADAWLDKRAQSLKLKIPHTLRSDIIDRATALDDGGRAYIDQMQLHRALASWASLGEVDEDAVDAVLPPSSTASVFVVFETAVKGDMAEIAILLNNLKLREDPYRLFALLGTQWMNYLALVLSGKSVDEVAADIGASPYALRKLPRSTGKATAYFHAVTHTLADLDMQLKTTTLDPWHAVERAVYAIAGK